MATRDRWLVETAERTIARLEAFDDSENEEAARAREEYELHHAGYVEAIKSVLTDLEATDNAADSE